MNAITFENILNNIKDYDVEDIKLIKKAYEYASCVHSGQKRESGEDYIIHPLNVAYILSEMNADKDTIVAGFLHDVVEDTKVTIEDIENDFNHDISTLVDGVTKISKLNFSSQNEVRMANTRKIITSLSKDVRIIIIKLADRLHNMRTLQYKNEFKQKENSLETIEIFAPLAYYIGAYRIKSELEDLSLKYLKPEEYYEVLDKKVLIEKESMSSLNEMLYKIKEILLDKDIPNDIKIRTKNIYGIYKKLKEGNKIEEIHDLLALKVIVDNVDDCYRTLGVIHSKYHPVNNKFKDYICNPKTNMYSSLHTTVFGPDDKLVQSQIRTVEMDKINTFGLTAYWSLSHDYARVHMQEDLKANYQFYESLTNLNKMFSDNEDFVYQAKSELFADKVYVYTTKGDIIELPKGSTPVDFAYKICTEIGNQMIEAYVNDEEVSLDYVLENRDRVKIITDNLSNGPSRDWADIAKTSYARRKIKDFYKV